MTRYRRDRTPGAAYFFTVVTYRRRPLFADPEARELLRAAFAGARRNRPFVVDAICLLPDHLHAIWTLPEGDPDYSTRWAQIKGRFSHDFLARGGHPLQTGTSRSRRGEVGIWQRRFWEHRIRDDQDWKAHVDYIHYNPVRHGYAPGPAEWSWSSFHRYVRQGLLEASWGAQEPPTVQDLNCEGEP